MKENTGNKIIRFFFNSQQLRNTFKPDELHKKKIVILFCLMCFDVNCLNKFGCCSKTIWMLKLYNHLNPGHFLDYKKQNKKTWSSFTKTITNHFYVQNSKMWKHF